MFLTLSVRMNQGLSMCPIFLAIINIMSGFGAPLLTPEKNAYTFAIIMPYPFDLMGKCRVIAFGKM